MTYKEIKEYYRNDFLENRAKYNIDHEYILNYVDSILKDHSLFAANKARLECQAIIEVFNELKEQGQL